VEKLFNLINKIPFDKQQHMLVGVTIFTIILIFVSPTEALIITSFVAILKEIYDFYHRNVHTPDLFDALATITLPLLLIMILHFKG